MDIDVDELLGVTAVEAGLAALAARNQHHLAGMSDNERDEAIGHWRELAVEVLASAHAALNAGVDGDPDGPGKAVIVLEDGADETVAVHATFLPQLEELPGGEVAGTPAQIAAISLLEALADEDEGDELHDH